MSSPARRIQRKKGGPLMEMAREMAREASKNHVEGVTIAEDIIRDAILQGDRIARESLKIARHAYATEALEATMISMEQLQDGERSLYPVKILVLTRQDDVAAVSMDAIATPVSFTTEVYTVISDDETGEEADEEDPDRFGAVLWRKSTQRAVMNSG